MGHLQLALVHSTPECQCSCVCVTLHTVAPKGRLGVGGAKAVGGQLGDAHVAALRVHHPMHALSVHHKALQYCTLLVEGTAL